MFVNGEGQKIKKQQNKYNLFNSQTDSILKLILRYYLIIQPEKGIFCYNDATQENYMANTAL